MTKRWYIIFTLLFSAFFSFAESVCISEFVASNGTGLKDEDGDYSDWIELHNAGTEGVNLFGWGLTDNAAKPFQWVFPSVTIPAGGYLVVFASGKDRAQIGGKYHTNFKLSASGEYLGLVTPKGGIATEFTPSYPEQYRDFSYGAEHRWYDIPTPGTVNGTGYAEVSAEVMFSREQGIFFETAVEVELALVSETATDTAVIYYTLDGSVPTSDSLQYNGDALELTNTTIIKARALETGKLIGPINTAVYIGMENSLAEATSTIPLVVIDHLQQGEPKRQALTMACLAIFEPEDGVASFQNKPSLVESIVIRKRGSTSAELEKYSLAVEIEDAYGEDKDVMVLGMPEESDWVFYAPNFYDNTMIRNQFMYALSNQIGRYAARTSACELYLNREHEQVTTEDYFGIYIPMEKIKFSPERISLEEPLNGVSSEPEITGSYLLKIDRLNTGESGFEVANTLFAWETPSEAEMNANSRVAQKNYLSNYFNQFYAALQVQEPVDEYLDIEAAIDHHLLNTFAFNIDALRLSTFVIKPLNGKIIFGPIWDFDRSLGSGDGHDEDANSWNHERRTDYFNYGWWYYMFRDIDFFQQYIDRWEQLRTDQMSETNLISLVNQMADQLREAEPRDSKRWGGSVTGRHYGFQTSVNHIINWIEVRLKFIDSQFVAQPTVQVRQPDEASDATIQAEVADGVSVYYTEDGSDPRLPGGAISSQAHLYNESLVVPAGSYITMRAYNSNHNPLCAETNAPPLKSFWSGPVNIEIPCTEKNLVITELMYSPKLYDGDVSSDRDQYAWLEVSNAGKWPIEMEGIKLTSGIDYTFPAFLLKGGESVVIAKNVDVFSTRYSINQINILGGYSSNLARKGETIILQTEDGDILNQVTYSNGWYSETDRGGYSLEIVNEDADEEEMSQSGNWFPSVEEGGTPGKWESHRLGFITENTEIKDGKIYFTLRTKMSVTVECSNNLVDWSEIPAIVDGVSVCVEFDDKNCFYRLKR